MVPAMVMAPVPNSRVIAFLVGGIQGGLPGPIGDVASGTSCRRPLGKVYKELTDQGTVKHFPSEIS
jgi:hypothetical protein